MIARLVLCVFIASSAFAETIKGYDILGRAKQSDKVVRQNLLPGTAEGVLQGTFGNVIPALEGDIKTGKLAAFRAHLANYTCIRNHNCESHELKPNDLKSLKQRAEKFEALHQRHLDVGCYISPWLEHDVKDKELVNKWFQTVKSAAPSCTPVCSAFTGWCPPGVLIEKHGNGANADIVSNDGESLWDSDSTNYWKQGSVLSLGWVHHDNNRRSGDKTFTPPSKRSPLLNKDDMLQKNALMQPASPKPQAPKVCKKVVTLEKPQLLKSNAEDYGKFARDDKPVILLKAKYQNGLGVLSPTGKKIACASNKHNLPPLDGMNRYYLGECANKSNVQVLKEAGSEHVFYRNGSTCYLGNAVRRVGYYRKK